MYIVTEMSRFLAIAFTPFTLSSLINLRVTTQPTTHTHALLFGSFISTRNTVLIRISPTVLSTGVDGSEEKM